MAAAFDTITSSSNNTNAHHPTASSSDASLLAARMARDRNRHAIANTDSIITSAQELTSFIWNIIIDAIILKKMFATSVTRRSTLQSENPIEPRLHHLHTMLVIRFQQYRRIKLRHPIPNRQKIPFVKGNKSQFPRTAISGVGQARRRDVLVRYKKPPG
jgi:hypothetical protein